MLARFCYVLLLGYSQKTVAFVSQYEIKKGESIPAHVILLFSSRLPQNSLDKDNMLVQSWRREY